MAPARHNFNYSPTNVIFVGIIKSVHDCWRCSGPSFWRKKRQGKKNDGEMNFMQLKPKIVSRVSSDTQEKSTTKKAAVNLLGVLFMRICTNILLNFAHIHTILYKIISH